MKWLTPPMLARALVGLVVLYEVSSFLYGIFVEAVQGRPFGALLYALTSPDALDGYWVIELVGHVMAVVALLLCIAFAIDLARKRGK